MTVPHTQRGREEILARLRVIAPERLGVDASALNADATLEEIGIDSYSLIELVFVAEEEFQIKIPTDRLAVKTVGDVVDVIGRQLEGRLAPIDFPGALGRIGDASAKPR